MTIIDAIRHLRNLKDLAEECFESEGEEMTLTAVSRGDIEALSIASTTLEGIRILSGIFDGEAKE